MAGFDPNEEWLGHVQPVGLVVAPVVLKAYELVPEQQTRSDTEAIKSHLSLKDPGPALLDAWAFFADILGWRPSRVAGSPGGAPIPDDLVLRIEESDIEIAPHWAVADPKGGWQMLVRVEAAGVDPDGRGALEGWEATPHQRLERLCKDRGVRTGILVTDSELRLIHAPRGETSGWLRFPLRSLGEVGGRPMLGGLKLLLSSFRLHNDAPERRLPALLQKSRDEQAEVSTKLAAQVLGALHELLRGLHDADRARIERLARERSEHVYDGLLTVLLRLVFLLYAEDRELIPSRTDAEARRLYDQGYGVRTLHARLVEDRARHELTMHLRRGAWSRLLTLFRLVHQGDPSRDWIRGRGGKLFDPGAFPFLQGQDETEGSPRPAEVSDECVAKVLDRLLVLGGDKLSYRTLDVEQIGSVYETVMGFTVETMDGPALAIRAGKNDKTPVFVNLNKLLAEKPNERTKFLNKEADRGKVTDKVGKALKEAGTIEELVAALTPIVDERASPGAAVAAPGMPLLQPTDERRRTGSHYTPRSLTAPIVQHALEPAFERIGPDATPEDVLSLKICDPAMGSGAFLVEACRALGDRLVLAWARWPQTRPVIPPDEDEPLHARRLVAQHCLYGVDRNSRAVDLAKLSLWLATLARDHEFTFVDHALKCGDSLVGLTRDQIAATHWDTTKQPTFVGKLVSDHLQEAERLRFEIQKRAEWASAAELGAQLRIVDARLDMARLVGDGVLAAFFSAGKSKPRIAALVDFQKIVQTNITAPDWFDRIVAHSRSLTTGKGALQPFHWEVEFPEVFDAKARAGNPGFDAIVGNPPFAGKNTIIAGNRDHYLPWLQTMHAGAHGNADLVAHFFLRAFHLLRQGGSFGLIATNTIGQGDTRASGLTKIISEGGVISRAIRRLKWPGEAAVVVSVVHVVKGEALSPNLDGRSVRRISAYLVAGELDEAAERLAANSRRVLIGSYPLGVGFLFDDREAQNGLCESTPVMESLIEANPRIAESIRPYIGGNDLTTNPKQEPSRFIIDFRDIPLKRDSTLTNWHLLNEEQRKAHLRTGVVPEDYPDRVSADYPELLRIVETYVRPEREKQGDKAAKRKWWKFKRPNNYLYYCINNVETVVARSLTSAHFPTFSCVSTKQIFDQTALVFLGPAYHNIAVLCSRVHETWVNFFAGTLEDRGRYNIEDCFETYAFPKVYESDPALGQSGEAYSAFRSQLMIARNEGLTKTYNRFHAYGENGVDVGRLRELHHAMDVSVLRAYGWDDLANRAEPEFTEQEADEGKTPKTRLDWPSDLKDEVLARLLALNAERAAEERALGMTSADRGDDDEIDDGEDSDA
ncbi:Eco57I restriction-modification methylase domain-containing protein [Rhizobium mayense]|uniref:site-specific DNA-methyltransferase (adenine-specific) n=1 Tax=Rhizobium mayense TaxID=1312184 RepID=A0ABT7JSY7_9HYPH|nr:DNA methyltransferase [Rhizobium mayense]MDL2399457.1 N-6 DNA methylase [Rhizobium mayense]